MRCHSFTSISSGWLDTLVGDPKMVFEASYSQIHEALRALLERRYTPVGVANVANSPEWQQSARRLVEILILGAWPLK